MTTETMTGKTTAIAEIPKTVAWGRVLGGRKAAVSNKARHGDDFYRVIGARGGRASRTGGFYANPELARIVGAKGGRTSKRRPKCATEA